MFRDCYFEYAEKYSGDYNLVMTYIEDSYDKFDSGDKYEVSTDTLPATAETLLYGLKHSENPLEFSVEIVNPDQPIPFKQMQEIKEWLFGQDGWKKLSLECEEFQEYHLKCLLVPDSDIVDTTGYRGIRCTLKNVSAYWYGEDKTIEFTKEKIIELVGEDGKGLSKNGNLWVDLKIESQSPCKIEPIIKFKAPSTNKGYDTPYMAFYVHNSSSFTESGVSMYMKAQYADNNFLMNCKYATVVANDIPVGYTPNNTTYDLLYFVKGINRVGIGLKDVDGVFTPYEYISFTYTPMYRIGGF